MSEVRTDDGVRLHVEEVGDGSVVLFLHEFGGDHRSWEPQLRRFARRYRCLAPAARGYPPSDVPDDAAAYSQERAVADAVAVLDAHDVADAHVVGLSMGSYVALHLARQHPTRVRSAVVAGCGYGSRPADREGFAASCRALAEALDASGPAALEAYGRAASRLQFAHKDPRGYAEFLARLTEHSVTGSRHTILGFQQQRPSLEGFADEFRRMRTPVLLVVGDEDDGAIEANVALKRTIPTAGLVTLPRSGHTLNLEEPERFNDLVAGFLADVDAGRWAPRDPATVSTTAMGLDA